MGWPDSVLSIAISFPVDRNDFGNPWLLNLNEVPAPPPIAWLPLAPAPLLLLTLIALIPVYLALRASWRWHCRRYRRQAIHFLQSLQHSTAPEDIAVLRTIPVLIRHVAIISWGQAAVIPVTDNDWLTQLGDSIQSTPIDPLLNELSWLPEQPLRQACQARLQPLLAELIVWINKHPDKRHPDTPTFTPKAEGHHDQ